MGKTAIVLGASGLVGSELLSKLLVNEDYSKIKVLVRKSFPIVNSKVEELIVDFNHSEKFADKVTGDVLFCCIGTTIKTAGSKEAFIKVDYTIPAEAAKIAKQNHVKSVVLISSLGADKNSSNFYLQVKGDVEEALQQLNFDSLIIVRPSMLLGDRKEFRLGELIGKFFMKLFSFIFIGGIKKYKAIEAKVVAKAMIELSKNQKGLLIAESDKLQEVGK